MYSECNDCGEYSIGDIKYFSRCNRCKSFELDNLTICGIEKYFSSKDH